VANSPGFWFIAEEPRSWGEYEAEAEAMTNDAALAEAVQRYRRAQALLATDPEASMGATYVGAEGLVGHLGSHGWEAAGVAVGLERLALPAIRQLPGG
jgi:hypothetical protein